MRHIRSISYTVRLGFSLIQFKLGTLKLLKYVANIVHRISRI